MEKKPYEAPAVLQVVPIRFETAFSGPIGGIAPFQPERLRGVDYTIPFLPKSGDMGSH
ncbi:MULTISPECIES: hypothetical protein [Cohnella]|uniref:hypothetical protein n=1 Tax=Cohnella TaxID=329857 RepID=UPI0015948218|nr:MULTISPECIES: hypothetical protein [Cohnella]MBN2980264.1 hypothetical protein [Cohnella algarum]